LDKCTAVSCRFLLSRDKLCQQFVTIFITNTTNTTATPTSNINTQFEVVYQTHIRPTVTNLSQYV